MQRVSRRTLLAAAGAAGAVAAGLAPGRASAATHGWWPAPGYTVANTGFSQHETKIVTSNVALLAQDDTVLGGSVDMCSPILDKGMLYVADSTRVDAVVESTCDPFWTYHYPGKASGTAQINIMDGVLTAAWNSPGATHDEANVVTLNTTTGRTISTALSVMNGGFDTILVDRGVVVLSKRGRGVLALRRADLTPLWNVDGFWIAAPVSANGRILIRGTATGALPSSEIRDLATGAVIWSGEGFQYDALAADEAGTKFYVAWGHSLQIVDASTGKSKWLASNVSPQHITVTPTRLYVSHTVNRISVFDAVTDKPAFWSRTFSAQPLKPIIAGGVLYVTVPGDRVHVLAPVTGNTLSHPDNTPTFKGSITTPVITNGSLYANEGSIITVYRPR